MLAIYIAGGVAGLLLVWAVYTHNVLVRARNKVDEAFSGIDVQLKRRHDLIPNLVQTVSAYARHERVSLAMVTDARSRAIAATTPEQVDAAETRLEGQVRGMLAVAEQYPELRATSEFKQLVAELVDVENEVQAARGLYNANVAVLNSYAQSFPASLVAAAMSGLSYAFLGFDGVGEDASRLLGEGFAA